MPSALKTIPHSSHWGAFNAIVRDGRVIDALPIAGDPDPSPMLAAIPGMVHGKSRIGRPMVREGWLRHRDRNRGAAALAEAHAEIEQGFGVERP